jgi:hypothetical protein
MRCTAIALLAIAVSMRAIAADAKPPSQEQPPQKDNGTWFIGRLKAIADAGDLIDPEKVGDTLGVKLIRLQDVQGDRAADCSDTGQGNSRRVTQYVPDTASWLGSTWTMLQMTKSQQNILAHETTPKI